MGNSSLFKVLAVIGLSSAMVASVAGGIVVGTSVATSNYEKAQQENKGENKPVVKVEKTNSYDYLDEYVITYEDGTTSEFFVFKDAEGKPKASVYPTADGLVPTVVVGENGNWVVNGVDSGVLAQAPSGYNYRSIVSIIKTGTEGLVDTYTITYSDNTTSAFTVTNGENGEQGIQGVKGLDGHTPVVTIENGYWTVDGVATEVLAQGPKGDPGENGKSAYEIAKDHGYTGTEEEWLASLIGEAGAAGVNGTNGNNGKSAYELAVDNGYQGTLEQWLATLVGAAGAAGANGENGANGKSAYELAVENGFTGSLAEWLVSLVGAQGEAGQNGNNGKSAYELAVENGYQGTEQEWLASLVGAAGANGENGANGKSAYELAQEQGFDGTLDEWLASLVGAQGAAGQNGENGQAGENGKSAYELAVDNGYQGTLEQWLDSLKGEAGQAGQNGQNGANGKSAYELAVDAGYTGTLEQWLASLVGEAGAAGQNGQDGANGKSAYEIAKDHGYTGTEEEWLASLVGAAGAAGAAGQNGQDGVNGKSAYELAVENGFQGSVTEWLASLKGEKGDAGRSIVSVTEIDDGDNNEKTHKYEITYSEGNPSYFVVTDGADGANGAQGIQGVKGDDGHTPVITINAQGYWVIDGTATTTYAVGPKGDQGDPGQNGQDGKSVLTGNGAPAASLGNDGDTYLDLDSLNLYTKTSTGWGSPVANIKGATGAAGQNGTNGTNGQNGAAGANGADGVSITSAVINASGNLIISYSDGTTSNAGNVVNTTTYTVSFDSDGGSTVADIEDVNFGATIHAPTEPTKAGYIFQGWYTPDGAKWSFNKDVVVKDFTLFARWGQFKVVSGTLTQTTATGDVVIPAVVDGQIVERIGASAFFNSNVTSVVVPATVRVIADEAFRGISNLTKVYLLDGLTEICPGAFMECTSLKQIVIPETVKTIGKSAFKGCSSLESMTLPFIGRDSDSTNDDTCYLGYIFGGDNADANETSVPSSLKTIALHEGIDRIGYKSFQETRIKNVIFPDSLETVGMYSFYNCQDLENVTFKPSSKLNLIAALSFAHCYKLKTIDIPETVTYIGNYAFEHAGLTSIVIPANCDRVIDGAFYGCTSLRSMTIRSSIKTTANTTNHYRFGWYFAPNGVDTDDATTQYVPNSLREIIIDCASIPDYAFKNCTTIEKIVVEESVTSIGAGAFMGCSSLKELTVPYVGAQATDTSEKAKLGYFFTDAETAVDNNTYNTYAPASLETVTITGSDDGHAIREYAFAKNTSIKHIVLGEKLTEIGTWAFYRSTVETINLDNVVTLDECALYNCSYLRDFGTPKKLTTIGEFAFYGCITLPKADLSEAPLNIPANSSSISIFQRCTFLKEVKLPTNCSTFKAIPTQMFDACYCLETVYIPDSVEVIGNSAFGSCYSLSSLRLHVGITFVGSSAFRYCKLHVVVYNDPNGFTWSTFQSTYLNSSDNAPAFTDAHVIQG